MQHAEPLFLGRTFDDFLFRPQHTPVATRRGVDLAMPLVAGLDLALPVVGANMDTVVGQEMAKALALEGGLGFLHRNSSIADQAERVLYVKSRHSYVIEQPVVLELGATMAQARKTIRKHKASGILIEAEKGGRLLAGILSHRDMPLDRSADERPVSEFMTPRGRLVTRPSSVAIDEAEQVMFDHRVEKLPLVDEQNRIRGLITMRDLKLYKQKPHSSKDGRGRLRVGGDRGHRRLPRAGGGVAHRGGGLPPARRGPRRLRPGGARDQRSSGARDRPLVVGNVATASGARWLADLGADAVKVGVGPGRGCRTRLETGAGVPQLQAVREAWIGTEGKVPIIADGGMQNDKDVFLAIACGASTVMLGSMLSGTDESPGLVVEDPATRQKVKLYRGMTSPEAVSEGSDGEQVAEALRTPAEGQSVRVPYVGSVVGILSRIRGHLQSAVSYAGESDLASAHRKVSRDPGRFLIPLSDAARRESFVR